jgi:hypothetical protein
MRRREFITLLGGAAVLPIAARAQQRQIRLVGALILGNADAEAFKKEMREGLSKTGYIEGRNVLFDIRSAQEASICFPSWRPNWWRQRSMSSSRTTHRARAPRSRRRAIFPLSQLSPTLLKQDLWQTWRGRVETSLACR